MDARQLKAKYCLDPQDLPNQQGLNVVTIAGVEVETYSAPENGRQVQKTRKNLHFTGFNLPLRLNNTRIDVLINMLGAETDGWRGRKIGLFIGASTSFGETKPAIFIHLHAQDTVPGAGPSQLPPAAAKAADNRPIGKSNADNFLSALAELGGTFGDFLSWLRRTDTDAHGVVFGVALEEIPRSIAPLMLKFLKDYPTGSTKFAPATQSGSATDKPRELVEQAPNLNTTGKPAPPRQVDEADDIPF